MATREELEIEIAPNGEVKIQVKGLKGKKCLKYMDVFKEVVGEVSAVIRTREFYEPEPKTKIDVSGERRGY